MHLVGNPTVHLAKVWFSIHKEQINSYAEFCLLFLHYYCSFKQIKEQKRRTKNIKLEWLQENAFEQQVLLMVPKLKNIDNRI